ncbi:site-2 protease family protein [Candidatus Collierbacteria bacterium]|nr:site-2 protease family protein [Candidatus Collierbacteria bacterium]
MEFVAFLLILSVLVLVHEWGHYITAKMFGVRVDEFGIGLPPRAKKLFVRKGTLFSLNWLPLGGFVKLHGETYDESVEGIEDRNAFWSKSLIQRLVILISGVVMNFVFGVAVFAIVYSFLGIPTQTDKVKITDVEAGAPADQIGLKKDDLVKQFKVEDQVTDITSVEQLVRLINENKGREVELQVEDEQGTRKISAVPRVDPPAGEGALGIALSHIEMKKYPAWQMPFRGMVVGMKEATAWGKEILNGLYRMVSGLWQGRGVPEDVAGPVGIYQVSAQVFRFGLLPLLQFMGILSINLAILNILPIPALDGGRVAFLGIEALVGRKLKNRIEGITHTVGMIILLSLMILITIRDVARLLI